LASAAEGSRGLQLSVPHDARRHREMRQIGRRALRKTCFAFNQSPVISLPWLSRISTQTLATAEVESIASGRSKLPGGASRMKQRGRAWDRLKQKAQRWVQPGMSLPASIPAMGLILQPILFIISTR
jgi:hypothetical protein